jgi:hypothetical protein
VETDQRYFRRRASEELAAARRAVTDAARERRLMLADSFLERLRTVEGACATIDYATRGILSRHRRRPGAVQRSCHLNATLLLA